MNEVNFQVGDLFLYNSKDLYIFVQFVRLVSDTKLQCKLLWLNTEKSNSIKTRYISVDILHNAVKTCSPNGEPHWIHYPVSKV
jgi:hypothetical protein